MSPLAPHTSTQGNTERVHISRIFHRLFPGISRHTSCSVKRSLRDYARTLLALIGEFVLEDNSTGLTCRPLVPHLAGIDGVHEPPHLFLTHGNP